MRCRRPDRAFLASAALVVALLATTVAAAPAHAEDTAESLFADARGLLKAGKTTEACDRFAASLTMFEARGIAKLTVAAMLNLADCREQNQQLATAWALFLKTATVAQNNSLAKVAAEARKRAGLVQPRISYLTITVADDNRVEGLAITRDGQAIETALWNQGVPIDGGTYTVSAVAPGNSEWSARVEVPVQNGKVTLEIPRLKRISDLAPAVATQRPEPRTDGVEPPGRRGMTGLQWGGIGAAGVGIVAIGVGVYFGVQAGKISDEAADWDTFDPERFAEGEDAERNSIIALSVGAAGVVTGGVLYYLGRRAGSDGEQHVSVAPLITPDALGLGATGRF